MAFSIVVFNIVVEARYVNLCLYHSGALLLLQLLVFTFMICS